MKTARVGTLICCVCIAIISALSHNIVGMLAAIGWGLATAEHLARDKDRKP